MLRRSVSAQQLVLARSLARSVQSIDNCRHAMQCVCTVAGPAGQCRRCTAHLALPRSTLRAAGVRRIVSAFARLTRYCTVCRQTGPAGCTEQLWNVYTLQHEHRNDSQHQRVENRFLLLRRPMYVRRRLSKMLLCFFAELLDRSHRVRQSNVYQRFGRRPNSNLPISIFVYPSHNFYRVGSKSAKFCLDFRSHLPSSGPHFKTDKICISLKERRQRRWSTFVWLKFGLVRYTSLRTVDWLATLKNDGKICESYIGIR